MKILDRLVVLAYARSYILCLVNLLCLYIIIDLFTNLEDFFASSSGFVSGLRGIGEYYMYSSARIFDRLCEPIVLLAAAFTVAWMQRNNELLPLLSAGVPTRRVLRPVFLGSMIFLGLGVANQELIIPRIAHILVRPRSDLEGKRETPATASYDSTNIHMEADSAQPATQTLLNCHCLIPDAQGGNVHLTSKSARFVAPGPGPFTGGWLLTDTTPARLTDWDNPRLARMVDPGRWFVYTRDVDFDAMTRNGNWYMLFSTPRLHELLNKSDSRRLEAMAVLFHMRLTRPLVGFLLVVMGLSVILRDPNRNVFISTGFCLVLCVIFFAAVYGCKFLGDHELLAPAMAAWLPVIIFGPAAFVMFDAIHT